VAPNTTAGITKNITIKIMKYNLEINLSVFIFTTPCVINIKRMVNSNYLQILKESKYKMVHVKKRVFQIVAVLIVK
jgi:hypothetical protein